MRQTLKRTLAVFLCLVLLGGAAPAAGLADWFTMQAGAMTITQYSRGDIVEFGWYPQGKETSRETLSQLNARAPAWEEWTSYGYYSGTGNAADGQMQSGDYMRYTDILLNGVKYRGVQFTSFRPDCTGSISSTGGSFQDNNGYSTNTVYWFYFSPLRWRVLDPEAGLILCETIIDSQAFNNYMLRSGTDEYGGTAYWGNAEKTCCANNYAESSIRKWLNGDFYCTAFSAKQQMIISLTELDNKCVDRDYPAYDADTTYDKIFLLSNNDILNTSYGFSSDSSAHDTTRRAKGSDYAKCQGLHVYTGNLYAGSSYWRLRSPGTHSNYASLVYFGGDAGSSSNINYTHYGVRPALRLQLTADIIRSKVTEVGTCAESAHTMKSVVTAPTCDKKGYTTHTCTVCGYFYTDNEVDALGHQEKTIPGRAATCAETGLTDGVKCAVCGKTITAQQVIDKIAHTEEIIPGRAATCTQTGLADGVKCSVCGEIVTAQEVIPALGHTEKLIPGRAASCVAMGISYGVKCAVCGIVLIEQSTIPKTGHTFGDWIISKEATKTEAGIMERACTVCGAREVYQVPMLPSVTIRNYVDNRTVDYRTIVSLTAEVSNPILGGEIHWFVDGRDVDTGESYTVNEAKKTFTVQAKYMDGDKVLDETEVETVKVKSGFFDKLKAFFRALFNQLPVVVQEYLGVEMIDRVLP